MLFPTSGHGTHLRLSVDVAISSFLLCRLDARTCVWPSNRSVRANHINPDGNQINISFTGHSCCTRAAPCTEMLWKMCPVSLLMYIRARQSFFITYLFSCVLHSEQPRKASVNINNKNNEELRDEGLPSMFWYVPKKPWLGVAHAFVSTQSLCSLY